MEGIIRTECSKCIVYRKKGLDYCKSCWGSFPTELPDINSLTPKRPHLNHYVCRCNAVNVVKNNGVDKKNYCTGCYEHNSFCELCFLIDNNGSKYHGTYYCTDCYNYYANNITKPGSYIEFFENLKPQKWYDFHHDN